MAEMVKIHSRIAALIERISSTSAVLKKKEKVGKYEEREEGYERFVPTLQ
jgi:hypothetical protein